MKYARGCNTSFLRGIIYPIGYEKRTKERGRDKLSISGETRKQSNLRKGQHQIRQTMCFRKTYTSGCSALVRSVRVPNKCCVGSCRFSLGSKCCVERSPFSFCQPELLSVVWDRPAGSSFSARFPYNPIHLLCIKFFVSLNNSQNNGTPVRLVHFE